MPAWRSKLGYWSGGPDKSTGRFPSVDCVGGSAAPSTRFDILKYRFNTFQYTIGPPDGPRSTDPRDVGRFPANAGNSRVTTASTSTSVALRMPLAWPRRPPWLAKTSAMAEFGLGCPRNISG